MERTYKITINFKPMVYYVKSNRQEDARKLAWEEYDTNDDMGNIKVDNINSELIE